MNKLARCSVNLSLLFMLVSFVSPARASYSVVPVKLTCEHMEAPIGLDVGRPRFGWQVHAVNPDEYGQKQTAYRIEVREGESASPGKIIWDSKWVRTGNSRHITYDGPTLVSDKTYYWRVKVRDGAGKDSPWSAYSYWSTGLFSQDDWKSQWIGQDKVYDKVSRPQNDIPDPWLRKTFTLAEKPVRAVMYVASIGFHELYINGVKAGDEVLAPHVTDHSTRARYVAYDITDLLQEGENLIGMWLGVSWSLFRSYYTDDKPATPMVTAQCAVYYDKNNLRKGEPDAFILTDGTWETRPSPNTMLGNWNMRDFGGEIWDSRIMKEESPDVYFREGEWNKATVYHPDLILSAQKTEGNRKYDHLQGVSVSDAGDGKYRVDMGRNFAGMVEIDVKGRAGDRIDFLFSEREQDEISFNMRNAYVIGPGGEGTFRNRFNYAVGRWITVRGLQEKPDAGDFRARMVRTGYDRTTTFECSNDLHNWIYNTVLWTFENLSVGGYIVDCPHRERLGYGGDAQATSETGMFNYDLASFYSKWMEDWRDMQGQQSNMGPSMGDGRLPHTAPTKDGGGGPSWGGISVMLPWYMYEHYGDTRILEENYEMMKGWLEWLASHVEGGVLRRFGGPWDFLADWLWPGATAEGMNNDKPEAICFNSCYMIINLSTAAQIARLLDDPAQAERWEILARNMRDAVHAGFYDAQDKSYCDRSMGNLTLALLAEVPPIDLREQVFGRLEHEIKVVRNGHIHVGITGGAMLFRLLRDMGRDDLLHMMTTAKGYPGWEHMRANDATTLWEMWEKDLPGHSLLHSSYLYPGAWYIEGVAGIKRDPETPGFGRFIVHVPDIPEQELSWVNCTFDSPAGSITSNWKREGGLLTHCVTVPPNTTAKVWIPVSENTLVKENSGYSIIVERVDGYVIYNVPAGKYVFVQEKR